jgi:hypothetical protein
MLNLRAVMCQQTDNAEAFDPNVPSPFYVHVTVHRDKFPYNKTNQMH